MFFFLSGRVSSLFRCDFGGCYNLIRAKFLARNENSTDTLYVQNFCFHKNVRRSMPGLGIPEVYDIDQWHSSQWIKCSGLVFFLQRLPFVYIREYRARPTPVPLLHRCMQAMVNLRINKGAKFHTLCFMYFIIIILFFCRLAIIELYWGNTGVQIYVMKSVFMPLSEHCRYLSQSLSSLRCPSVSVIAAAQWICRAQTAKIGMAIQAIIGAKSANCKAELVHTMDKVASTPGVSFVLLHTTRSRWFNYTTRTIHIIGFTVAPYRALSHWPPDNCTFCTQLVGQCGFMFCSEIKFRKLDLNQWVLSAVHLLVTQHGCLFMMRARVCVYSFHCVMHTHRGNSDSYLGRHPNYECINFRCINGPVFFFFFATDRHNHF